MIETTKHMEPGDWIALASGLTALLALTITIYQAYLTRVHNRCSLTPHLYAKTHIDYIDQKSAFLIVNAGPGPAFVKGFKLLFQKTELDPKKTEVTIQSMLSDVRHEYFIEGINVHSVLMPGDVVSLIELKYPEHRVEKQYIRMVQAFDVIITYQCSYGKTKVLDTRTTLERNSNDINGLYII